MNPENHDFLELTKQQIQDYIDTKTELIKLEVAERAAKVTAALFSSVLILVLGLMLLVFLSLMAGYYFAHLFNSYTYGFGMIAGIYLLLLILVLLTRKSLIERPMINKVIHIIFEHNED